MAVAVRSGPSLADKLERLGQAARYDLSCACGPTAGRSRGADDRWIYPLLDGRRAAPRQLALL
jgi:hypothetical protein